MALLFLPCPLEILLSVFFVLLLLFSFLGIRLHVDKTVYFLLICGFSARLIVIFLDYYFHMLPYSWDDYFITALQIKENVQLGYPAFYNIFSSIHTKSYALFNAIFILLFGDYEILVRIANGYLGMLVALRIYHLTRIIFHNENAAKTALFLTVFWPSLILFNSLNMRDTLIMLFSLDVLYRVVKSEFRMMSVQNLFIFVELALLYYLRVQNALLYLAIVTSFLFLSKEFFFKNHLILRRFIKVALGVFIIYLIILTSEKWMTVFHYISAEMKFRTSGGSSYLHGIEYNSWLDIIKWMPIRFIYFTFGPFLWQIRNPFMLLAFFESLLICIFFLLGIKLFVEKKDSENYSFILLLFLYALIGLLANSVVDSNFGTAIRHKLNYIPILFIFSSYYLHRLRVRIF